MKEREIRSRALHSEILRLSKKDVQKFLKPFPKHLVSVSCPACASQKSSLAFIKFGLPYRECIICRTLYLSPRPTEAYFNKIYSQMESVMYWASDFYPSLMNARRKPIYREKAKRVRVLTRRYGTPQHLVDVGCGFGIFLEEISHLRFFKKVSGVEPMSSLARVCVQKGFNVYEKYLTEKSIFPKQSLASVVTCFEVLEHILNPQRFLRSVSTILRPGGIMILSFPSGSGLDLRVLWKHSNIVYPPHHINLITVEGAQKLIERTPEFDLLDISTPGVLDVDIVHTALQEGAVRKIDHFFDYVFFRNNEMLYSAFQEFIQQQKLSSHLWLVIKKK